MNRYKTGGPSKASATTLCQKCLKRGQWYFTTLCRRMQEDDAHIMPGHYSYECTASKDDRPYVSRPSRSQQLLNPKLAPKISAVLPEPKPESKAITRYVMPWRFSIRIADFEAALRGRCSTLHGIANAASVWVGRLQANADAQSPLIRQTHQTRCRRYLPIVPDQGLDLDLDPRLADILEESTLSHLVEMDQMTELPTSLARRQKPQREHEAEVQLLTTDSLETVTAIGRGRIRRNNLAKLLRSRRKINGLLTQELGTRPNFKQRRGSEA